MSIDKRTAMYAIGGAAVLGIFAWQMKGAKGKKLLTWALLGAGIGAGVEVIGMKMILKK